MTTEATAQSAVPITSALSNDRLSDTCVIEVGHDPEYYKAGDDRHCQTWGTLADADCPAMHIRSLMDIQPVLELPPVETAEGWTRGMLKHYVDVLTDAVIKEGYESHRLIWDGTLTDEEQFGEADEEVAPLPLAA